ncbi:MAG: hypothetical protein FWD28_00885 [Treponema sp.]|nr:hypothetical protein [Treponema sp.]
MVTDVINKNFCRFFTVLILMIFLLLCGAVPAFSQAPQLGAPTLQQVALNSLPAIPIAGNNLKFQFGGDTWIATRNGRNFLAGSFVTENTGDGVLMTLTQTHIFLRVQWIRTPGPSLVLEYKDGPPSSFRLVGRTEAPADAVADNALMNQNFYSESSGSILAMFGVGLQFLGNLNFLQNEAVPGFGGIVTNGILVGVDLFFIGKSGFTISIGIENLIGGDALNIYFPIGLGYVYFDDFYFGGLIKLIGAPNLRYGSSSFLFSLGDGFITPTIIGGYNFNGFSLGGQLSYTSGIGSKITGFKFSLNVGVSLR